MDDSSRTGWPLPCIRIIPALLLAFGFLAFTTAAEPMKPADPPRGDPAPTVKGLDDLKNLPLGAVIVVVKDVEEGMKLRPKSILLDPDEYQRMRDEIAALKAKLAPDKPLPPFGLNLTGRVDANVARLTAVFEFATEKPGTLVALGCGLASPVAARLDDQLPALTYTDEGFVVLVEKPGKHQLTLEMEAPLVAKGTERGFDLDLPRASATRLELDLPEGVKEVRLTTPDLTKSPRGLTQVLPTRNVEGKGSKLEAGAIGAAGRVELAWKAKGLLPAGPPLLVAETRATVRVGERDVTTDLDLTLKVTRGQTSQWRLLLPPQARLIKPQLPEGVIQSLEVPDPKTPTVRLLKLKESSAEPITLTFQVNQPRVDAPMPIGPFAVLGTTQQQQGSLLITAAPEVRVNAQPRIDPQIIVQAREISEDERKREPRAVAAFQYWHTPAEKAPPDKVPNLPPYLSLDTAVNKGQLTATTSHTLRLTESGWRITTDIEVTPRPNESVEQIHVQLPMLYELDERKGPKVGEVKVDANRVATITLMPRQTGRFKVTLEGKLPAEAQDPAALRATVELPRLQRSEMGRGQITVQVPREFELIPAQAGDPVWEKLTPGRTEYTWEVERLPERVEVAWQPYRNEVIVDAEANVTLRGQQAHVEAKLGFSRLPAGTQVPLWVPESVATERVRTGEGHRASTEPEPARTRPGFRLWTVTLGQDVDRKHPLVVEYSFPLPAAEANGSRRFAVPLVVPDQATQVNIRVRVWSPPGVLPALAQAGPWEERLDRGDGRPTLPALGLVGSKPEQPPVLLVKDAAAALATVFLERGLVRAKVKDNGYQSYRVWFLLSRLTAPTFEIEMPAPVASLNLKASLRAEDDTLRGVPWEASEENNKVVRLVLPPELLRDAVVLDLEYELPPGRNGMLQTTLHPPVLRGDGGRGPVRWQATLPASWVPLYGERGFSFEQGWGWRGWLLAPRPAVSESALEQWFLAKTDVKSPGEVRPPDPASVVCWRSGLEPLTLNHVPQQAWLLVCSLGLIAVGIGLYFLSLPHRLFWPALIVVVLAVSTVGILWPGILSAVIYGCEPGAVVLLVVLGVPWLLHQRYRRQVVFMPGFTRMQTGSSLIRTGSNQPVRPREPSTVDAVPPGAPPGTPAQQGS